MAKHPVPKKKMSNARTAHRYRSFVHKKHIKLQGFTQVVLCAGCGNPKLNQALCPSCHTYRGRAIHGKGGVSPQKVIKVKA